MNTYEERSYVIDIMKCLAIYLVVLGHLVDIQSKLFIAINVCHMPIFFLIAGFFSYRTLSFKSAGNVFASKLKRLFVPYIIWSLVAVLANVCLNVVKYGNIAGSEILKLLYNAIINAQSIWFFLTLFLIFCIMLFIKKINCLNKSWIYLVVLMVIMLLPNEPFMICKLKNYFIYFLVGYFVFKYKERLISIEKKYRKLLCILSFTFLVFVIFLANSNEFINYAEFMYSSYNIFKAIYIYLFYSIIGLLGFGIVYYISTIINKVHKLKKIFANIGIYSMDIYPIHMMLVKFIIIVPLFLNNNWTILNYIYYPIYSIFITCFCWFISKNILHKFMLYKCFMIGEVSIKRCLSKKIKINIDEEKRYV